MVAFSVYTSLTDTFLLFLKFIIKRFCDLVDKAMKWPHLKLLKSGFTVSSTLLFKWLLIDLICHSGGYFCNDCLLDT